MKQAIIAALFTAALDTRAADLSRAEGLNDREWLPLGVYSCVTDRIVGIQGKARQRFAGQIRVDAPWVKFTVKTSQVSRPAESKDCRADTAQYRFSPHYLWFDCDAEYEVTFESSTRTAPMRGDTSNDFEAGLWEHFNIFRDGTYRMFRDNKSGGFYLNEGHCEASEGSR